MVWILPKLSNYQQVAPSVRTGGSRHTGLAAPPHRNIQDQMRAYLQGMLPTLQYWKAIAQENLEKEK